MAPKSKKALFKRFFHIFRKTRFFRNDKGAFKSHKALPMDLDFKLALEMKTMESQLSLEKRINDKTFLDHFLWKNEIS